jgi:hypothetical protein
MYVFSSRSFYLVILMNRSHMHFISKAEKGKSEAVESSPIPTPETIIDDQSTVIPEPIETKEDGGGGVLVDRPSKRVKV